MVSTGYIFKPGKDLTDDVAKLANTIRREHGLKYINVSKLYHYAVCRMLKDYPLEKELFIADLKDYFENKTNR